MLATFRLCYENSAIYFGGLKIALYKFPSSNSTRWVSVDMLTDIALYFQRFMYRYTVLLYTTCTDELYFCVQNSYKQDTPTYMNISLYVYIDCILLYNLTLPTYTCGAHTMLRSVELL